MFKIDKLNVKIKDNNKEILKDFSLTINDGEIHAIMGPNGVGKSTLSKVIMHHPDYVINAGTITYNKKILNDLSTDTIARLGIYLLMQDPSIIDGVGMSEALRTALKEREKDSNIYTFITKMKQEIDSLNLPKDVMHRSINKGLSGGERKKNEVLGLKVLKPSFIILDELDSGLDVDSLKVVANNINEYLKEHQGTSVLIITHYSRILDLIKPDFVHEMKDGKIIKTGDITLAKQIEKTGFSGVNEVELNKNYE